MELFMNDNICTRVDHCLQIQGSCENVNCKQEYRRVCMKCIPFHKLNDKDFNQERDIKYMDDLTRIFSTFKQENSQTLNNIFLQCNIQNMILLTEIIQFINDWSLRLKRLMRIQVELQSFEKEQWSKLNINDYISDENNKQGIYKYLQNIEDQLTNVQNMMDFYIKYQGSNNNEFEETFKKNHVENTIQNMFERTLQSLQDYLNNTIEKLFINQLFKNQQGDDNPYVILFEILLKYGFHLISDVPQKQFDQVRDQFSDKIKEHQNYYLQAFSLVYSTDSQKHLDESLELISRSIKLNGQYAKSKYLKGIILFDKKKYDESIETFKQCIKLDDKYLDAYNALGNSYRTQKRYEEAKQSYDKALQINPQFVKSMIGKADVLFAQGQLKESNELYDKAIKLDPKNSKAYCAKGMTLHYMHQYQEAIDTYNLVLNLILRQGNQVQTDQAKKQLKLTHVYYNMGLSFFHLCEYDKAIDMFNREIEIDPNNIAAYEEKGQSLVQQNKFDKALVVYEKIIQLAPNDVQGYIGKGEILHKLEKTQEAKKEFQSCIEINPNCSYAQNRLKQL